MKLLIAAGAMALAGLSLRSARPAVERRDPALGSRRPTRVEIMRDRWGIAHIYGRHDADVVFGMIYAQAEDDFHRVERNYLVGLGWLAQDEGESALYSDLRARLFVDERELAPALRRLAAVAQVADGRLGRRSQLLSRQAPGCHAARHPALRAVDGAVLHRGQHRRRHRERRSRQARGLLRHRPRATWRAPTPSRRKNSRRFERFRHRALAHRLRARDAVDQSSHLVLLPLRTADGERGGSERVRRGDLGTVFHLPGIQRAQRLDAHLLRRRCHR